MSHLFFSPKTSVIPNTYFIAIALCILLSSCSINVSTSGLSGSTGPTSVGSGVLGVQIFVEPGE
jgi:hypothetical protein